MHDCPLYALHGIGGREVFEHRWDGLTIREISGKSLVSLATKAARAELLREAVRNRYGLELPDAGCRIAQEPVAFLWMGPQQWFVESESVDSMGFVRELTDQLGEHAALTDQSDAWTELHISGGHAHSVLEKLCLLDLHPSVFGPGRVARTVMEHIGVVIALLDDTPLFSLRCPRSLGVSLLHALRQAADSTCGPD